MTRAQPRWEIDPDDLTEEQIAELRLDEPLPMTPFYHFMRAVVWLATAGFWTGLGFVTCWWLFVSQS